MTVGGSALPGGPRRTESDGAEQVRHRPGAGSHRAGAAPTPTRPRDTCPTASASWEVGANDQLFKAADYEPLIVAYRNGAAVRISDVGEAVDSVEDLRNAGYANGKPAVLVIIFRQPGANIIETVDRIRAVAAAAAGVDSAGDRRARWRWIGR